MKKIDFHAHILPGADHGCTNIDTALQQLRLAKASGMDLVVATPHFYAHKDTPERFLARRARTAAALQAHWDAELHPQIMLGCEVHLYAGLERLKELDQFCAGGTDTILIELPGKELSSALTDTLLELRNERNLTVVLAHIERYPWRIIEPLLGLGFLAQVNAVAFSSLLQRRRYVNCAKSGSLVAIGSDIHGVKIGYSEFPLAERQLGAYLAPVMQRSGELLAGGTILTELDCTAT